MPMLLCRTVWLNHYDNRAGDSPVGNHRWVAGGGIPHEIKNFLPTRDGEYLGFVQVRYWGKINIDRLGASSGDAELHGVTIVWCAQHIDGRGLVVTGWYRNATVYREKQPTPPGWALDEEEWPFRIKGRVSDSQLIDASLRDFVVQPSGTPKDRLVFGMADLAYVEDSHPALAVRLQAYIDAQTEASVVVSRGGAFGGGHTDAEQNARVEKAAVDFVKAYYKRDGWNVRDVSDHNYGWDLECKRRGQLQCVEVKGRTAARPAPVALSSNERRQFERATNDHDWAKQYRLAVVHEAVASPEMRLYKHALPYGWRCELTSHGITTQPLGLLIQPNA